MRCCLRDLAAAAGSNGPVRAGVLPPEPQRAGGALPLGLRRRATGILRTWGGAYDPGLARRPDDLGIARDLGRIQPGNRNGRAAAAGAARVQREGIARATDARGRDRRSGTGGWGHDRIVPAPHEVAMRGPRDLGLYTLTGRNSVVSPGA